MLQQIATYHGVRNNNYQLHLGIFPFIIFVHANCGENMVLTEKFGRISFLEVLAEATNNCSWTIQPPSTDSTALIVRFETLYRRPPHGKGPGRGPPPRRPITKSSTKLIFPGGNQ